MKANTFLAATLALGLAGTGSAFAADPVMLVDCSEDKAKAEAEQIIAGDTYEVSLTCVDGWSGQVYYTDSRETPETPVEENTDIRFQLVGTKTTEIDGVLTTTDACAIDLVMVNSVLLEVPVASKSEGKCSASKGNGKQGNKDKLEVAIKKVSVEI